MRTVAVLPPIKNELQAALLNLTDFENFATHELIAMARDLPGGTKIHIPDRLTAIVLLLGTRQVDLSYGKIFEPNTVVVRTLP